MFRMNEEAAAKTTFHWESDFLRIILWSVGHTTMILRHLSGAFDWEEERVASSNNHFLSSSPTRTPASTLVVPFDKDAAALWLKRPQRGAVVCVDLCKSFMVVLDSVAPSVRIVNGGPWSILATPLFRWHAHLWAASLTMTDWSPSGFLPNQTSVSHKLAATSMFLFFFFIISDHKSEAQIT